MSRVIPSAASGKQKRSLQLFLRGLSLILILAVVSACDMMELEAGTALNSASSNYGYGNSSYRYFYYPRDNAIYYMSGNSVYRMDIHGENFVQIEPRPHNEPTKKHSQSQFIYVFEGRVYYNDMRVNKTYSMKTDGSNHRVEENDKSGPMGMYGTGENAVLYFDSGKKYLKDDTLYFSTGLSNLAKKSLAGGGGGSPSVITSRQADNFVFAPEGIYFRLAEALTGTGPGGGIVRVDYNAEPEVSGNDARLKKTDMEEIVNPGSNGIHQASAIKKLVFFNKMLDDPPSKDFYSISFNTLNVSRDFVAYIRRSIDNNNGANRILDGGLNVISRSGEGSGVPRTVRAGLNKFDIAGGISIIGDYIYWMTENSKRKRYELYRVKKDGTGYRRVTNMLY